MFNSQYFKEDNKTTSQRGYKFLLRIIYIISIVVLLTCSLSDFKKKSQKTFF